MQNNNYSTGWLQGGGGQQAYWLLAEAIGSTNQAIDSTAQ